jgi:hypothetical protein
MPETDVPTPKNVIHITAPFERFSKPGSQAFHEPRDLWLPSGDYSGRVWMTSYLGVEVVNQRVHSLVDNVSDALNARGILVIPPNVAL